MVNVLVTYDTVVDALRPRAIELANRLALPLARPDDTPLDAILIVVTQRRLELRSFCATGSAPVFVDFVSESARSRRVPARSGKELIARAIGLRHEPLFILDATAGWARDAFLLAQLGCRVRAVERSPIVVALVEDGIARARKTLRRGVVNALDRLTIEVGDTRHVLVSPGGGPVRVSSHDTNPSGSRGAAAGDFVNDNTERQGARRPIGHPHGACNASVTQADVVYLDPMYPVLRRSALNKKKLRILRALVGEDADAAELFEAARGAARRRVVVKRPRHAPPLAPNPDIQYKGSSVRFDVYLSGSSTPA